MNLKVGSASYNETSKTKFKKEGMALLRKVAKILGLEKGKYNIRYNAAGIACSGDCTLHADEFYASFNLDCQPFVLVRTCKGQKDYTGGPNQWFSFDALKIEGADGLAGYIQRIVG